MCWVLHAPVFLAAPCADMGGSSVAVVARIRDAVLAVGLAMGVIFAVVGFMSGNYGLVGLGVVGGLAGYFSRPRDD